MSSHSIPDSSPVVRSIPIIAAGLCCLFVGGCDVVLSPIGRTAEVERLEPTTTWSLEVTEPSGLTFGASREELWVVGNHPERIYRLSASGAILDTLDFDGDDVEGIVFDPSDSALWIAEERRRQVVHISKDGTVTDRWRLDVGEKSNSGLEGIALDGEGELWVLNEKNPGLLIELTSDQSIRRRFELDFAPDFSGLTYDPIRNAFWIASHQGRCLHLWSQQGGLLQSYEVPVDKIEGLAMDPSSSHLFAVSESDQTLTRFDPSE